MLTFALVACTDPAAPQGPTTTPGDDASIAVFDAAHVYFTGETNARSVDVNVSLPGPELSYETITLDLKLSCPGAGCDAWDRLGWLAIVRDAGTASETTLEMVRFITPYGVRDRRTFDVTDLRPLLQGDLTFRVFIDTWVGPGSPYGDGWQVDATLDWVGGTPARPVLDVLPVYGPTGVVYGDPARPTSRQIQPVQLDLPTGTTAVAVRSLVTGHGQGNADNCAEFCEREQTWTLGETATSEILWRDNCDRTAAPDQQGNWRPGRAGWCPGADVKPWVVEERAAAGPVTVAWSIQEQENTCRPDSPVCEGCVFGTGCEYDGGSHTEPFHQLSALAIVYGG